MKKTSHYPRSEDTLIRCGQCSFQGSRTFHTAEDDIYSWKPEGVDVGLSKNDPKPSGKLGKTIGENPQPRETRPKVFLKRRAKICYCFYLFICSIISPSVLTSESGVGRSEVGLMEEFCSDPPLGSLHAADLRAGGKLNHGSFTW